MKKKNSDDLEMEITFETGFSNLGNKILQKNKEMQD